MIRKAVAAIVEKEGKFLLVHKVKMMDSKQGPEKIEGEWGFSIGGVKPGEIDFSKALMRELKEETGSDNYRIVRKFEEKMCFTFPPHIQKKLGFEKQETTMFLVEYLGDGTDITPQDEEIDKIEFFTKDELIAKLHHDNSREFFKKFVNGQY
ncbi:MAG: NUDIX hydrolase [Candidatus Woesearchaeota archaeon]|nr:NUDIX hydrolase [Candidatus Woesearchaeota archaeon]